MAFRFPSFGSRRPKVHTGSGYGVSSVGRYCVNRTFGCITSIIIIAILAYLFYKNPPWFAQMRDNFLNFFRGR